MKVTLIEYPDEQAWIGCKQRTLITVGKKSITPPTMEWKKKILEARHSPIRYLRFSFLLEDVPYFTSTHLVRHVHAQPYVKTQRNDRQKNYDRNKAPQDAPVDMIWDLNSEEFMVVCNKRLCSTADPTTRKLVQMMADEVLKVCPEFDGILVPACEYNGRCHEMFPCGRMQNG